MQTQRAITVQTLTDYEQLSAAATRFVTRQLEANPRSLLCLATGSTPTRAYQMLAMQAAHFPALFSELRAIKLDEWEILDDPGSCEAYLQKQVIGPLGITPDRYTGFVTDASPNAECRRISQWLAQNGPIDLCILGLGINGHLGLNEPAPALSPYAHRVLLSESTRGHSMLNGSAQKPRYGLTLGMAEILQSRQILLLVSGPHKKDQLRKLSQGEVSTSFPASLLWLHPHVTILCDRAAAEP